MTSTHRARFRPLFTRHSIRERVATLTIYDLSAQNLVEAACKIAWTSVVPERWSEFAPSVDAPAEVCARPRGGEGEPS